MTDSDVPVVACTGLGRVYGSRGPLGRGRETVALRDLTLDIPRGHVFGLLGPNGAGKTTTVRILATLLTPTAGSATVLGYDVVREASQVRRNIGLILGGERGLYGRLTGLENLMYFGALNHINPKVLRRRAGDLLDMVGLSERADSRAEEYSRGMKQRLHIARGLLTDPAVVFMDEPTIGLDPEIAQDLRQLVPQLAAQGKTILLTTHYMLEADQLCETIAIINRGELVALGSPTDIKREFSKVSVREVTVSQTRPGLADDLRRIEAVQRVDVMAEGMLSKFVIQVDARADLTSEIATTIGADNVEGVVTREPTLEEAYLSILR